MNIVAKGIDVSSHQRIIDWPSVKASGVEFAILRCGYGNDFDFQDDPYFHRNESECEKVGMPYGVYLYSYAEGIDDIRSEARHVLRLIGDKKPLYPVYLDLEDAGTVGKLSNETILELAKEFVTTLENAGFWAGIYANLYWWQTKLTDPWYDSKARWIASYSDSLSFDGQYGLWQYSSKGFVPGISGNVDQNYSYVNYPVEMRAFYDRQHQSDEPADILYTVVAGDTLWGIAQRYGTTYQILAKYNGIKNPSLIYPGEIIRIPQKSAVRTYIVQPGDTLSGIAARYGTTYQILAKYNGIKNPSLIYPGEIIRIP